MKWCYILDKQKGPGRLMKKGLTLIVIGHVNFILSAIVHGSVLRHVSKPRNEISTEYTASNIISVSSGLLVSGCASVHFLMSHLWLLNYADLTLARRPNVGVAWYTDVTVWDDFGTTGKINLLFLVSFHLFWTDSSTNYNLQKHNVLFSLWVYTNKSRPLYSDALLIRQRV